MYWRPDFCPSLRGCRIELIGPETLVRFISLCPHHKRMLDSGMQEQEVFDAIVQSSRLKEAARWSVKVRMGLDKEHPGVPYSVDANGNFTIVSGAVGAARAALRSGVADDIAGVRKPAGTSTVSVE